MSLFSSFFRKKPNPEPQIEHDCNLGEIVLRHDEDFWCNEHFSIADGVVFDVFFHTAEEWQKPGEKETEAFLCLKEQWASLQPGLEEFLLDQFQEYWGDRHDKRVKRGIAGIDSPSEVWRTLLGEAHEEGTLPGLFLSDKPGTFSISCYYTWQENGDYHLTTVNVEDWTITGCSVDG